MENILCGNLYSDSTRALFKILNAYYNDAENSYITDSYDFSANRQPSFGSHIRVSRKAGLYYHHGIYESDQKVYQFCGESLGKFEAVIKCTTLGEFLGNDVLEVRRLSPYQKSQAFSAEKTIQLAEQSIGESDYNLLDNNCEHFANFCIFGIKKSKQVDDLDLWKTIWRVLKSLSVWIFGRAARPTYAFAISSLLAQPQESLGFDIKKFYRD